MRLGRSALLAFAGASAWLSFGTLAVLDASPTRIGALPPIWLLIALVLGGAAFGWFTRIPSAAVRPLLLTALLWLPWLPGPIPAAFLLWSGPLEGAVWIAALAGTLAAGVAGADRLSALGRWAGEPRRAVVLTVVLATASSLTAAHSLGNRIPAGDEPHYLIIAQSLLLDGDLRIENNHQRADYRPYLANLPRPDYLRRGRDGQIYSVHAPGLPALVVPAFALGSYPGARLFMALIVALGGALAWHAAWLLTRSAAATWLGWAAVFFSPPLFFHSFTVYPDGAGATLAMAAVWLLARLQVDPVPLSRWVLVSVGTGLALLPWLHSRFALIAAGLGLAVCLRLWPRPQRGQQLTALLAVPVLSAIAWFAFFKMFYGAFSPMAPYGSVAQNRLATLQPGLPGLFFDQQFGVIANAPVFAVALVGLLSLARRHRRLAAELTLVALPYVLAVASFVMWWAGYSAPGRFLTILLLPAVLPLAWVCQRTSALWSRALLVAAALVGWLFVAVRSAVNTGALLYNARDGYDLLLDWLSPTVNLPLAWPSFHRDVVASALTDTVTWGLVLGVAALAVWARLRRAEHPVPGTAWALTGGALSVAVMIACSIVWTRYDNLAISPSSSQLAFLQEWDPEWHPHEIQLSPVAVLSHAEVMPRLQLDTPNRGPRPGSDRPLLSVPLLPAGEYELVAVGTPTIAGTLDVVVGRSVQTIEHFDLADRPAGFTGVVLRLPVLVHSITIRGDERARASLPHLMLRPRSVRRPSERLTDAYARRASRYATTRVFFLDEYPFMEPAGFWTRGGGPTDLVIDADPGSADSLLVRAGPVATRVTLSAGEWQADYALQPGQVQTVQLPGLGHPLRLLIETSAAFRPAALDPASSDLRDLGVWVEFLR